MLVRRMLFVAPMLLTCTPCALGQLPKKLEKCLPYPTLAQEIREMQPEPARARVRVHVIRVEFDSNDGIPADAQQEISEELRSFSVNNTNMPGATTHTGTGATDANSEFTDRVALISNQPIPSTVSEVDTQEIFVGGIYVRNNTLTYSSTTVTVTNIGPNACSH